MLTHTLEENRKLKEISLRIERKGGDHSNNARV